MLGVGAAQEHHADGGVVAGVAEGLEQLGDGVRREGITAVRAVDGHAGDALGLLIDDFGELAALLPTEVRLHGA